MSGLYRSSGTGQERSRRWPPAWVVHRGSQALTYAKRFVAGLVGVALAAVLFMAMAWLVVRGMYWVGLRVSDIVGLNVQLMVNERMYGLIWIIGLVVTASIVWLPFIGARVIDVAESLTKRKQ